MLDRLRRRRPIALVLTLVLFFFFSTSLFDQFAPTTSQKDKHSSSSAQHLKPQPESSKSDGHQIQGPVLEASGAPSFMEFNDTAVHPVQHLITTAKQDFSRILAKQSTTLEDAVNEYRERYGLSPPPHFDKWFEFAQKNDVQLIDEFDTIHDLITPFWGLKPATIRGRAREALGYENFLLGIAIRNHSVSFSSGDSGWQLNATVGMMQSVLPYLPDMDLAFNIHDEPRVILPHEDLTRLVDRALRTTMPAAAAHASPVNDFTATSPGLSDGPRFEETKLTRFSQSSHEAATWTTSRMSCGPDTPVRRLDDDDDEQANVDDMQRYALTRAGFVYNVTAMSDICLSPSLSKTYGFFNRPNAFKVTHDLFPIFSQSKVSSFADLTYPSPWYWYGKVEYKEKQDMAWSKKKDQLFWRGSTTGGFSRNGGWRRQHRQRVVSKVNDVADALIFTDSESSDSSDSQSHHQWSMKQVPRGNYRKLTDIHFTYVGQCDEGDCEAQRQFFSVKKAVDMQKAWQYRFLLDMDGNAFSGRFHAFLRSQSQVFKLAVAREWHGTDRLRPWVHYVPLSLQGDDWLAAVQYFADTDEGRSAAEEMARTSSEWAAKTLRKVDLEAWLFRLLLEYARVIDDDREIIGFDPASAEKKLP